MSIERYFKPIKRPAPSSPEELSEARPSTPVSTPTLTGIVRRNPTTPSVLTPARNTNRPHIGTPSTPSIQSHQNGLSDDVKHLHHSYDFLQPPKRRDINRRAPDDPDYDEKTLYVPGSFLDSQTPAMRQWWLIKQKNMDAILFFKMGKFYELFNEDAVIGVNNLDINYMKGDDTRPAHAGFPEISFSKYSKILIDRGYKVLRIEQTETPAMMEQRCNSTGKKRRIDKVVQREICQVTTKGTQMLGISESVFHSCHNQFLLAIYESTLESGSKLSSHAFGVCFIDVTVGKLYIGQFSDDHNLSNVNILLAHHTPTEVLYERNNLSQDTLKALMKSGALMTVLKPSREFWPIKKALSYLKVHNVFETSEGKFEWPQSIKNLFEQGEDSDSPLNLEPKEEYKLALNCFGALVYYLQSQLILEQALKCTAIEHYETPLNQRAEEHHSSKTPYNLTQKAPMIMDHVALRNMEIFVNSSGTSHATLFASINNCKTHFGQRLLKNWLCSPLTDVRQINNRLDAIEALISNDNASLMNEIIHVLSQTPDLERLLTKIKSQCFKSESDSRAVMFDGDQYSKAKISSFLNLLNNFKRLKKFISSISKTAERSGSQILKRLLTFTTDGGLYPDYSASMEYFDNSFDHESAKKTGKIIPAPGVDLTYDECQSNIEDIKSKLDEYLEHQKEILKCRHLEYFGTAKNRYQIQVPEAYCKSVPHDYRIETTRKGVKRYYTPTIEKLFQKMTTYEEEMKKRLDGIMSKIFAQFAKQVKLWSGAIECMATLDVLQSIASFVRSLQANCVPVCRPTFIENSANPLIEYTNGRHPSLVKGNPDYIANDLKLDDRLILLSGPNMGGKSTLMRQTALLAILAQIGSFTPASKFRLTPVDRIFSRLGASDRLLEGESTFFTELVETSAMLRCASRNSLLLLDELGRGTSTFDGTAIAYSVLREISDNIKCRCLFSTHYHSLVTDFKDSDHVRLVHMACKIERESDQEIEDDPLRENITFLYKIADGPVARSYGFNVAKLAGLDNDVIREAFAKAKELELRSSILDAMHKLCLHGNTSGLTKSQVLECLKSDRKMIMV